MKNCGCTKLCHSEWVGHSLLTCGPDHFDQRVVVSRPPQFVRLSHRRSALPISDDIVIAERTCELLRLKVRMKVLQLASNPKSWCKPGSLYVSNTCYSFKSSRAPFAPPMLSNAHAGAARALSFPQFATPSSFDLGILSEREAFFEVAIIRKNLNDRATWLCSSLGP